MEWWKGVFCLFYQPIILSQDMYTAGDRSLEAFPQHWHSDFEIMYCHKGSFCVKIDTKEYTVKEGQILFVESSVPHEYYDGTEDNWITLLRVGSAFLGSELFREIAQKHFETPILEGNKEAIDTFCRISDLCKREKRPVEESMQMRGLIYLIISLLIGNLPPYKGKEAENKRLHYILNIQNTLDYVSANFDKNITVESAAKISGYEKSSFCRIFKQATDTSFHQYLSNYRIQKASILLAQSNKNITEIGESVGFPELKTFCRVFKQIKGVTPSAYRNAPEKIIGR